MRSLCINYTNFVIRQARAYVLAKQQKDIDAAIVLAAEFDTLTKVLRMMDDIYGEYFGAYPS